ncbi:MAG: VCBS domain-containing protein, partial [Halioglobus sp.]
MSEEGENNSSRDEATENLFNFSERDEARKESPEEDDHSQVIYNEELSLQNIFIDKIEGDPQTAGVRREVASDAANEAGEASGSGSSDSLAVAAAALSTASGDQAETSLAGAASDDSQRFEDNTAPRSSGLRMSQDASDAANEAGAAALDKAQASTRTTSESESVSESEQPSGLESSNGLQPNAEIVQQLQEESSEPTPVNSAPNAGNDAATTVLEGAQVISGQLTATDTDQDSPLVYSIGEGVSAPEGFLFNSDGSYSFDPAVQAYDHLNVGDSQVVTVPFTVTDEEGATDTALIQITVTGTNDAPIAGADVFSTVEEGASLIAGQLVSVDVDDNAAASFAVSEGGVSPAGFALNSDGSYTFDPSSSEYEYLGLGDSQVLTIPITVTDEHGATDVSQIQITITGTSNEPLAGANVFATVDEGASVITGQLSS